MEKLLLEVGVQDDVECPYCGFEAAQEDYESRGEHTPFKKGDARTKFEYNYWRWCPLCGWQQYEASDELIEEWYNIDDTGERHPDNPYEIEPKKEALKEVKKIKPLVDKLWEVDELDIYHILEKWFPIVHKAESFPHLVIKEIF